MGDLAGNAVVDVANLGTSAASLMTKIPQPLGGLKLWNMGKQDYVRNYQVMTKGALALEVVPASVGAVDAVDNLSKGCK